MSSGAVHLVCGSTGAGKTTYAVRLAEEIGAVRFSIDEWMSALFWMDAPRPLDPAWSMERVERCAGRIWATAVEVCRRGVPAVLEIGLTTVSSRQRYVALGAEAGLEVRLHLVEAPVEERWRRVQARNLANEGQLPFEVTREMFDFVEAMWEPPTEEERAASSGMRAAARGPSR